MKILSIQRIGRVGIVQYIDAEGKAHARSFDPTLSDDQVVEVLSDATNALRPPAPHPAVTPPKKQTAKKRAKK